MYTCRSCIVEALNSCSSRCPECNLPGWLNDLKSNRQLANVIRLLTTMKKQISHTSTNVDVMSTFVDSDESSFDGASYDLRREVKCDSNQHEYNCLFVKPRDEACLIEQCMKSSKGVIAKLSTNKNESESKLTGSHLYSSTSSPLQAPSNSVKRVCKSRAKFAIKKAKIGIEPLKYSATKHSSAELGLLKQNEHQSIHCDVSPSRVDMEFPCATCISVKSSCAHGARQCHQESAYTPMLPWKAVGQRSQETSEGMCMQMYV